MVQDLKIKNIKQAKAIVVRDQIVHARNVIAAKGT